VPAASGASLGSSSREPTNANRTHLSATSNLTDVAHVIQVAVAPVFLLSGIGGMLSVLITRLGRIVDRSRTLDERLETAADLARTRFVAELGTLARRARLIDRAIALAATAGIFVCLVIITLFVDYLFTVNVSAPVAVFFLLAMLSFIAAFGYFLREVLLATAPLRHQAVQASLPAPQA
jgi:Protein of unknown function (DUF2721)